MRVLARLLVINVALWSHVLRWAAMRVGLWRGAVTQAQSLASTLERLGTTFVKLGQGLSLHRELLPEDYVAALQRLQGDVAPFPSEVARAEIQASFGRPVEALFARFEERPFAAGSIAQVHAATMFDGRSVIVKVRRPAIGRQIREDLRILRWFIRSVQWLVPGLREVRPFALIDELERNLRKEIDLRQEAASIGRFVQMFYGSTTVYVPAVVDDLYTECVVVQEMSHGRAIDEPKFAAQGPALAEKLVDAYLRQLFVEGVFHGDPHPGNLFLLEDGRICLHDFGLIGHLDGPTRITLVAFMLAFVREDSEWLLDSYLDLGMLATIADRARLRSGIEELIQDYARKPLGDWSLGEVLLRVTQLGGRGNTRVPHHLLVLIRAMFLLESTVRRLDPKFNLLDGLFLKAGALLEQTTGSSNEHRPLSGATRLDFEAALSGRQLSDRLGGILHRLRRDGVQLAVVHHGVEPLAEAVRTLGLRVSQALLALGLFIGASVLLQAEVGPHWRQVPLLSAVGYTVATWLTWRLLKGNRSTR